MDEEEVGRRGGRGGRGGRAPRGGGGLPFATKAALATGAAALLCLLLAVFANQGSDPQKAMDDAGYSAAQALAGTDPEWWSGKGGPDLFAAAKQIVGEAFGDAGAEWWKEQEDYAHQPFDSVPKDDRESLEKLQAAHNAWSAAQEKWGKGHKGDTKDATYAVQQIANSARVVQAPDFQIVGAWIRKRTPTGQEGDYVVAFPAAKDIHYDGTRLTNSNPKVAGTVVRQGRTLPVTIYAGDMTRTAQKGMRAYVALWRNPTAAPSRSGNKLGLVLAILGPFLVGLVAWALASGHTKDVRSLAREIDRLGTSGNPERALRTQGGDASLVARAVERMVSNLEFRSKHGDADLEEIAEKERKVAEEIHGALIAKNPPRLTNWEVETLYKPGFEIAGDHFEYFPIDKHHLGVILLDTNVRGLPAALVMASARSYVRAAAPGELSPAAVLKTVNGNLAGDLPPGRHVTALYVVIDTREGKATIASAGHLPLLVYRHASGKVAKVNPAGIALGLDPGPVFDRSLQEGDIPIGVGDRIVLYTDGALNIANEYGEEFGEARFYEAVSRKAPMNSQAFVNFVGSAIDQFHLNSPQSDDVTISTVKRLR